MSDPQSLLDRGIPDLTSTAELPPALAAEVDYLAGRTSVWATLDPAIEPGVRARALVLAGDSAAAREVLVGAIDQMLSLQGLAAATWAASRVGPSTAIEVLADRVAALPAGFLVADDVPLGSGRLLAGLVAAARGDLDVADAALADAAIEGDKRAPVWGALARLERARVLWCAAHIAEDHGGAATEARRALAACQAFFSAGGYHHLAAVTRAVSAPVVVGDIADPCLGHFVAGERWTVGYGVQPAVEVAPSKGLVALHHLLAARRGPVPAVVLDRLTRGEPVGDLASLDPEIIRSAGVEGGRILSAELRAVLVDDRVRSRVSKLLRRTIDKLADLHPLLGTHLRASVETGYACSYRAAPEVTWRL